MGLFTNLFKQEKDLSAETKANFPWNSLSSETEIETLVKESFHQPIVIFKHSTRCGISRMVLKQFEQEFDLPTVKFYFLDLLNYRTLSQTIASRFQVVHESPQIIVLENGNVTQDASHHDILNISLEKQSE